MRVLRQVKLVWKGELKVLGQVKLIHKNYGGPRTNQIFRQSMMGILTQIKLIGKKCPSLS